MNARRFFAIGLSVCLGVATAHADLTDEFAGFTTLWEVGDSGLASDYHADTVLAHSVSGSLTGTALPNFGPLRVSYPSGVGTHPSPGGSVGANFDQGALGVKVEGGNVVIKLASGLDALGGYYYDGYQSWYGQGDLFLTVADGLGIGHFAALSAWARDGSGAPRSLNGGHFQAALDFHTTGGSASTSLEGHLVRMTQDSDVTTTGGSGSYHAGNAPEGLDLRAFAAGGEDLGLANLVHSDLWDLGQHWYVQTWSVPLAQLSTDSEFELALHAAASCGNDQIGGRFTIPEPNTIALALLGALGLLRRGR